MVLSTTLLAMVAINARSNISGSLEGAAPMIKASLEDTNLLMSKRGGAIEASFGRPDSTNSLTTSSEKGSITASFGSRGTSQLTVNGNQNGSLTAKFTGRQGALKTSFGGNSALAAPSTPGSPALSSSFTGAAPTLQASLHEADPTQLMTVEEEPPSAVTSGIQEANANLGVGSGDCYIHVTGTCSYIESQAEEYRSCLAGMCYMGASLVQANCADIQRQLYNDGCSYDLNCYGLCTAPAPSSDDSDGDGDGMPSWAVAVIVLIAVAVAIALCVYIKKNCCEASEGRGIRLP